jgi:hypothetical protein
VRGGGRKTEIVVIGVGLEEAGVVELLDSALMTPAEIVRYIQYIAYVCVRICACHVHEYASVYALMTPAEIARCGIECVLI